MGIVGSREFPHLDDVRAFVHSLVEKYPQAVIVSGGAKGVDTTAEQEALGLGLDIVSFRPTKLADEEYGVDRWELGLDKPRKITLGEPASRMWATYAGAAWYRNLLIAETSDVGVGFWDERSHGTQQTKDAFTAEKKDFHLYTPRRRFECE